MDRIPTIALALSFAGLITVLCMEHKRVAGVRVCNDNDKIPDRDYAGVSNRAVQKPGPAYLLFNLPWPPPDGTKLASEPLVTQ